MNQKVVIGITGGVGAGKSTVLNILQEDWFACVLEADQIAKELMEPDGACFEAVVREFGEEILGADGRIDRVRLAEILYSSEEKRILVNSLTHPLVRREAERRIAAAGTRLVIYEAALPEEAYMDELCREIWYVHAPEGVRIRRLMESRGYSREKCLQIMNSQESDADFRCLAHRVIENGGTPEETRKQLQTAVQSVIMQMPGGKT